MTICPADQCTGCYACINACAHNCITMRVDDDGAYRPVIDEKLCTQCKLCVSSCPNNKELEFHYPIECFASWITDVAKRKICASGGIGTIIGEYVLKNGGILFGSRYDDNLRPIMTWTDNFSDIEKFKGSRYVQSYVGDHTFREVKKFLQSERIVAFIGTPCQIAGLLSYLRCDYSNLITVDLICHGVCPTKYLDEEISYLKQKYQIQDLADIRFRGNDGNNFRLSLWNKNMNKLFPRDTIREKILHEDVAEQYYIQGFLKGISMRENCYSCQYARPERVSDITIGDFIGLGRNLPFDYPTFNVSSVMINTPKGQIFYRELLQTMPTLKNILRPYSERLEYRPSLLEPFERHQLNHVFLLLYKQVGFAKAIRTVMYEEMKRKQREYILNHWTYVYRIPRKMVKILLGKR